VVVFDPGHVCGSFYKCCFSRAKSSIMGSSWPRRDEATIMASSRFRVYPNPSPAWPPTHMDAHGSGEFAGELVSLGDMVLDMDDLIASATAEVHALPMRHPPVVGAMHTTNGAKHPCFCLDHEQAPVLIFETVGVRTNFDAELKQLLHPIDEAVDDVMDEDVATPPHIIQRST